MNVIGLLDVNSKKVVKTTAGSRRARTGLRRQRLETEDSLDVFLPLLDRKIAPLSADLGILQRAPAGSLLEVGLEFANALISELIHDVCWVISVARRVRVLGSRRGCCGGRKRRSSVVKM